MPKGALLEGAEVATSAVALRQVLHDLEIGLANLKGRGRGVLDLLHMRDRLDAQLAALQADGMDLRPEKTRVETIDNIFMRKASELDSELGNIGGLAGARREEKPPEEHWWWYGDLYVAERRRKSLTKTMIIVAAVLAVVLGGNYLMDRFFGLSPVEKEARRYESQGEQYLRNNEIDNAILEYEKAVAVMPDMPEAQLTLGVLYEIKGETDKSKQAFAKAESLYPKRHDYLVSLASAYQAAGKLDQAMAAVTEAIALEPQSAQAIFIRGGIEEDMGKYAEALTDYDTASTLAQQQGQDALYVLAKTRMGMLLQRGPASNLPTEPATPAGS
jgi:tetratricopeptide (TPR) repeat protein